MKSGINHIEDVQEQQTVFDTNSSVAQCIYKRKTKSSTEITRN